MRTTAKQSVGLTVFIILLQSQSAQSECVTDFYAESVPNNASYAGVYFTAENISSVFDCAQFCSQRTFCRSAIYDNTKKNCAISYDAKVNCREKTKRFVEDFTSTEELTVISCVKTCNGVHFLARHPQIITSGGQIEAPKRKVDIITGEPNDGKIKKPALSENPRPLARQSDAVQRPPNTEGSQKSVCYTTINERYLYGAPYERHYGVSMKQCRCLCAASWKMASVKRCFSFHYYHYDNSCFLNRATHRGKYDLIQDIKSTYQYVTCDIEILLKVAEKVCYLDLTSTSSTTDPVSTANTTVGSSSLSKTTEHTTKQAIETTTEVTTTEATTTSSTTSKTTTKEEKITNAGKSGELGTVASTSTTKQTTTATSTTTPTPSSTTTVLTTEKSSEKSNSTVDSAEVRSTRPPSRRNTKKSDESSTENSKEKTISKTSKTMTTSGTTTSTQTLSTKGTRKEAPIEKEEEVTEEVKNGTNVTGHKKKGGQSVDESKFTKKGCFEVAPTCMMTSSAGGLEHDVSLEECMCFCASSKSSGRYPFECMSATYYHNERDCVLNLENRETRTDVFHCPLINLYNVTYLGVKCSREKALEKHVDTTLHMGCLRPNTPSSTTASTTTIKTTKPPVNSDNCFIEKPNYVLEGTALAVEASVSPEQCKCYCANSDKRYGETCQSTQYYYDSKTCLINKQNRFSNPENFNAISNGQTQSYFEYKCATRETVKQTYLLEDCVGILPTSDLASDSENEVTTTASKEQKSMQSTTAAGKEKKFHHKRKNSGKKSRKPEKKSTSTTTTTTTTTVPTTTTVSTTPPPRPLKKLRKWGKRRPIINRGIPETEGLNSSEFEEIPTEDDLDENERYGELDGNIDANNLNDVHGTEHNKDLKVEADSKTDEEKEGKRETIKEEDEEPEDTEKKEETTKEENRESEQETDDTNDENIERDPATADIEDNIVEETEESEEQSTERKYDGDNSEEEEDEDEYKSAEIEEETTTTASTTPITTTSTTTTTTVSTTTFPKKLHKKHLKKTTSTTTTTEVPTTSPEFEYPSAGRCSYSAIYQTTFRGIKMIREITVRSPAECFAACYALHCRSANLINREGGYKSCELYKDSLVDYRRPDVLGYDGSAVYFDGVQCSGTEQN